MLLWKDGRFHAFGISFAIPDGFYLESEPETIQENGLSAWTPDMHCRVIWWIEECDISPYDGINNLFSPGSGMTPLGEIEPMDVNGLSGCSALYKTKEEQLFEARLGTGSDSQLIVIIEDYTQDIASRIKSPEIQTVLRSIQAD